MIQLPSSFIFQVSYVLKGLKSVVQQKSILERFSTFTISLIEAIQRIFMQHRLYPVFLYNVTIFSHLVTEYFPIKPSFKFLRLRTLLRQPRDLF